MPYIFDFAPAAGILRCIFEGRVTDLSLEEFYTAAGKLVERLLPCAAITDFSAVTSFEVSPDTIARLARSAPVMIDSAAPRFVVAPSPHLFGMARMFQIRGESTRAALRIVRSPREAYAALGVKEPAFEPIAEEA